MRIAVATDHAGFKLKQELVEYLEGLGHGVVDLGTNSEDPAHLTDF
jgi:ribose 5-phosphate isomerase B